MLLRRGRGLRKASLEVFVLLSLSFSPSLLLVSSLGCCYHGGGVPVPQPGNSAGNSARRLERREERGARREEGRVIGMYSKRRTRPKV